MKKYFLIIASLFAALLSGVLIKASNSSLNVVMYGAYLYMPLLLGICISIVYYKHAKRFLLIICSLAIYGALMTAIEIILFRPWEKMLTPVGSTYTEYNLDALYPGFGIVILLFIVFLVFTGNILFEFGYRLFEKIKTKNV